MALITSSIGSAGGRTYSTITAWVAALPANLVTAGNSYVGECYNDSQFTDAALTISGHTTDATHTITLTAASGQSFVDNANSLTNALKYNQTNGAGWSCGSSYTVGFNVSDANVSITRMQFKFTGTTTSGFILQGSSGSSLSQCIVEAVCANNYPVLNLDNGAVARNCLIRAKNNLARGLLLAHASIAACCTIVADSDLSSAQFSVQSGYGNNGVLKDCTLFGFSSGTAGTFGTSSNNCTDLASAPGTSNQVSKTYTSQFVGTTAATPDFRLKTGADCINNGVTDTTNVPAANDIVGTSRPQGAAWDIGCWELVVASTFRPRLIRWAA